MTVAFLDGRRWSAGYGYADIELGTPVDPAVTKFRVGSTAKSMTAMAVGQLVEQGRLDLDAPIQDYLPDYLPAGLGCAPRFLGITPST